MTGYASMNNTTLNQLGRKLQSRFHEQGYGTLADKTRARVLTDRAEQKRWYFPLDLFSREDFV